MTRVVWIALHEVLYEGDDLIGVFSNAAKARKLIDLRDPPIDGQKWRRLESGQRWDRKAGPFGSTDYAVVRYRIDEERP